MNCIMLVIDSLNFSKVQNTSSDLMPFLSQQALQGMQCSNVYSQAPYTEAATMALYTGQNTLDYSGYMERYNRASKTIFEVFRDAGYKVFFNALQPQCFPSSLRRGITDIYYNRGYDNEVLWRYRIKYYSELFLQGTISERDYNQLIRIFDDNFVEWIQFLNDILCKDKSVELIWGLNKQYDANKNKEEEEIEYSKYQKGKREYIENVLRTGQLHAIFQIPYFEQIDFERVEEVKKVLAGPCKKICRKIRRKNVLRNLLMNEDIYPQSINALKKLIATRDKQSFLETGYLLKNALFINNLEKRYGEEGIKLKGQPSFRTHVDHLLNWLDVSDNSSVPFFACLHIDDIHYPEVFFTYDAKEAGVLLEDIDYAKKYLKKKTNKTKGSIIHELSLRYADNQCKYLVNEIHKRGLYDDTIFIVTADHGFSYSGYPIRNKPINTFYLENFKIPFWAFGGNVQQQNNFQICSSTSIPVTMCELFQLNIPKSFIGKGLFAEKEEIATIEYCGGGCPDISRRELMIAAFDKNKMLAVKVKISEQCTWSNVVEVYDLINDPLQRKNLKSKYAKEEYKKYFIKIQERLSKIKELDKL